MSGRANPTVVIAESDLQVFQAIKTTLQNIGFRNIQQSDNIDDLRAVMTTGPVDLLIAEARLKDGTTSFLIRQLRAGTLGPDPFLPVITMVTNPTPDLIRGLIDDGPDDVIIKPFSAKVLSERIDRITGARKPFVVTRDYVGPDRRAKARDDSKEARTFEVPNALKQKIDGRPSRKTFSESIQKTIIALDEAFIESLAGAIVFQVERILPKLAEGHKGDGETAALEEIIQFSDQAHAKLETTKYASQDVLFNTVSGLATALQSGETKGLGGNIEQMQKLAQIIKRDFKL